MSNIGPRFPSGGGSHVRADRQIQQRPRLGWKKLLVILIFSLVVDVLIGIAVYFISCGQKCKDHFSGVTGNSFADSLYFSSTTLTTTGFGDIAPTAPISKAFTAIYIAGNTLYINFLVYPFFISLVQIVEGRNRRFRRRFVLAISYCLICLLSGIPFLICLGGLGWGNAFYTVVVSFSSTGYGDYTFTKMWGRIFNSLWLLVSHLVNYRLGGLISDAGDDLFLQTDDDARDRAATTAAADLAVEQERDDAVADLAVIKKERDDAVADLAAVEQERAAAAALEQERDAAVAARDSARRQLDTHMVNSSYHIRAVERERDAAIAARNSAREDYCVRLVQLVHATLEIQAADARRAAAEERFDQQMAGVDAAVQQTVANFVLMLTDAYLEAAVLAARLEDAEYDLSRLENPT